MRRRLDSSIGFVPPPGYKPRAEARIYPPKVDPRTLGPLLRALADRTRPTPVPSRGDQ